MNEKTIDGSIGTAFGHEIDNYQSEKQRYTGISDYYKEFGAFYVKKIKK